MIVCPICGFRNLDANDRCFKCSALLRRDEQLYRESIATAARRTRKDRLVRIVTAPWDWLRHRPWMKSLCEIPDDGVYRYPFTAGLLSVLPGAGHYYAGQKKKAAVLFVAWSIFLAIILVTLHEPWSNWLLLAVLLAWFLMWSDAVSVAARRNGDSWRLRKTLALACGALMLVGVTLTVGQYLGIGIVSLEKVGSSAMRPTFLAGDRVFFSSIPFWFRGPRVGEIVMFDPPRFTAEQDKDVYSINISKYFQRVMGAAGDRIVKKENSFLRNGLPIPPNQLPILWETMPNFDVVVPEDTFFIPVTGIPSDAFAGLMGAGSIAYVGQAGYVFPKFPELFFVGEDVIYAKGYVVVDPPPRRRWLE